MFLIHQKILLPSIFQVQFAGIGWFANQYVKKSPGNGTVFIHILAGTAVEGPTDSGYSGYSLAHRYAAGNGILNNQLYLGRITDVPALRIIDDKTWKAVQKIKSRYSSRCGNKRQTKKRLLSGLIKCGCCGGSMTIINRERYYCSARRERGTCDSTVGIKAVEIEDRVLSGLKDILLGNEGLIDAFVVEFKAEIARLRKQRGKRERQSQKEMNRVNAAIKRCLKFVTEGDGDPGLVRDELRALEERKRDLEREISSTRDKTAVEVHPNIADLYRKKVMELQTLLTDETSRPRAMEVIRSMIDHIEVQAGEERGKPEVILVGALAQILTYTQQNKTAASNGSDGRVLMVAGACNWLNLLSCSFEPKFSLPQPSAAY